MLPEETFVYLYAKRVEPRGHHASLWNDRHIKQHAVPYFHHHLDRGYVLPWPDFDGKEINSLMATHSPIFWQDRRGNGVYLHPQLGLPFTLVHDRTLRVVPMLLNDYIRRA